MIADLEAEFGRGDALKADGKNRKALKVFDRVIAGALRDGSVEADKLASMAWQAKCQVLVREKRWSQTVEACNECLTRYGGRPEFWFRWVVADVRRMACLATAQLSVAETGERGAVAHAQLDSLIAWLREQPEMNFRSELAKRLAEKVRWCARQEEGLDALDELVNVLPSLDFDVLARLNKDEGLLCKLADKVVQELPALFAREDEDQEFLSQTLTEALDAPDPSPGVVDIGLSVHDEHRMMRLSRSLDELADLLGTEQSATADELRAGLLINLYVALSRVGETAKAEKVFERVAALNRAAMAACDRMAGEAAVSEAEGNGVSAPTIISTAVFKARVLSENDDQTSALSVLDAVITKFGGRSDPLITAALRAVVMLREDILLDADGEPTEPRS